MSIGCESRLTPCEVGCEAVPVATLPCHVMTVGMRCISVALGKFGKSIEVPFLMVTGHFGKPFIEI